MTQTTKGKSGTKQTTSQAPPKAKDLESQEVQESTAEVVEAIDETLDAKEKDDLDKLVDDIDAVLEENVEEFIANFIQRGGE